VLAVPASAQQGAGIPVDTAARVQLLGPVIIAAERFAAPAQTSAAGVSTVSRAELAARPVRTLGDALRLTPGLVFVDFDGLGADPQIMVRGFYGGGEAEYVVLLLDGRPVNAVETGRINWELIPISAVESIEIVRGGASAAWGDAALGGVINVVTRAETGRSLGAMIASGGHGATRGSATLLDSWNGRPVSLSADFSRSDGFREHAERRAGGFSGSVRLVDSPGGALSVSTTNDWRRFEEPGSLPGTAASSQSDVFYRHDASEERTHRIGIDGHRLVDADQRLSGSLTGEYRSSDRVRTLVFGPFGDTKNRVLGTARLLGSAQVELGDLPLPGDDDLMIGVDASIGRMSSEYYLVQAGDRDAYIASTGTRGPLDERGRAVRAGAAGFFNYGLQASAALRITLGGRLDWLTDSFDPRAPSTTPSVSATHVAFSPKAGASWRFASSDRNSGHLYANVARSFKAPTPDQLFDQRMIPVEFDPFEISFANADLDPQYGTSIEAGINHRAGLIPGRLIGGLSLAAYTMDLRDELDFDFATFSYQNIGRSRHRGIEAALDLEMAGVIRTFTNYTLQAATSESGDDRGRFLKAIPRHFVTAGATLGRPSALTGSVVVSSASRMYLDDANSRRLDDWTRWDARLAQAIGKARIFVDVFNLLDAKYATTGYPDPFGGDVVYYYPAARRTFQGGLSWGM
jgi:outer membrane receptor protein involved in Fe transport